MDGFSGYNQIKMYPEDEKHTSFWTSLRVYCYTVMPFESKNAGATYHHAMSIIFHSHLWKMVECYDDDITIKSRDKNIHLHDLKIVFDIMRARQLKWTQQSLSWVFQMVSSWDSHRNNSSWSDKVKTIQSMQPPKNLKELRGLQGRLTYIQKFITNISGHGQPFTRLMKKAPLLYGIKPARSLSKILKNTSPSLQSWWLSHQENHSFSM